MKKASLVSTILAISALVCAGLGLIFLIADWKDFDYDQKIKFYTIAFTVATLLLFIFTLVSKNKYLLIPISIASVLIGSYFIQYMVNQTNAAGLGVSNSALDKFMLYNAGDTTFLQLILFAFFVTTLVLSIKFKYKWAIIVVISYLSIMILGVLKFLPSYFTEWDFKVYTFTSSSLLLIFATAAVFFSQFFFKELTPEELQAIEAEKAAKKAEKEAELEAKKQAEAEAKAAKEAEAEAKKQAEAEAKAAKEAEKEAQKQAEAEAKAQKEAEKQAEKEAKKAEKEAQAEENNEPEVKAEENNQEANTEETSSTEDNNN